MQRKKSRELRDTVVDIVSLYGSAMYNDGNDRSLWQAQVELKCCENAIATAYRLQASGPTGQPVQVLMRTNSNLDLGEVPAK